MEVKIKDQIYNSEKEPIMLVLSPRERLEIYAMAPDDDRVCFHPEGMADDRLDMFTDAYDGDSSEVKPYQEPPSPSQMEQAAKLAKIYNEHVGNNWLKNLRDEDDFWAGVQSLDGWDY